MIEAGLVLVNGRVARASRRLRGGDTVRLELPPPPEAGIPAIEPEDLPLTRVFEDEWLLVIDKPAGMVVHPGAGVRSGTLVHALVHHYPSIVEVGGEGRPGIVHRLDKDTSGLMVVAKTARAYRGLVEAVGAREVRRVYQGLVWGEPRARHGRVEAPIGRDPRDRKRMAVVRRGGRRAATAWRVLEGFGGAALLELVLETGRTHQIRVHLSHIRHPVIGDPVYGGRGKKLLSLGLGERSLHSALLECLPRQALHASELGFAHPVTGEALRFEAPLPEDFAEALGRLRAFRDHRRT